MSWIISSISCSYIFSPIVIIAYLNSSTVIFPSLSESKTFNASLRSSNESGSEGLSLSKAFNASKLNSPVFYGSTLACISKISLSVGFLSKALIIVPNSLVWTFPSEFLSNKLNISVIYVSCMSLYIPNTIKTKKFKLTCHFT